MRMPSLTAVAAVAPVAVLALGLAACPAPADPCADKVLYTGGGTDEAWATMLDAKAHATTDPQGPTITSPAAAEKLPKADPPTFTWESPLKVGALSPAEVGKPRRSPSLLDRISSAVIAPAYAHEPPVSSDVYLVEIPIAGDECPVTVVTTDLSVKLDAASWARLTPLAGQDLTLSVTSAYLQTGRVQEGPYKAAPVTFQVAP